ncbi:hypothetical protein ACYSNR_09255 [Enterococcus sp. LJL128]
MMFRTLPQIEAWWYKHYDERIKDDLGKLHKFDSLFTEEQLKELKAMCDRFITQGFSIVSDTFSEWFADGSVITPECVNNAFNKQYSFCEQEVEAFLSDIRKE